MIQTNIHVILAVCQASYVLVNETGNSVCIHGIMFDPLRYSSNMLNSICYNILNYFSIGLVVGLYEIYLDNRKEVGIHFCFVFLYRISYLSQLSISSFTVDFQVTSL